MNMLEKLSYKKRESTKNCRSKFFGNLLFKGLDSYDSGGSRSNFSWKQKNNEDIFILEKVFPWNRLNGTRSSTHHATFMFHGGRFDWRPWIAFHEYFCSASTIKKVHSRNFNNRYFAIVSNTAKGNLSITYKFCETM